VCPAGQVGSANNHALHGKRKDRGLLAHYPANISMLDRHSLRRFETQVSKLPALASRQEQKGFCSIPRGFGCAEYLSIP